MAKRSAFKECNNMGEMTEIISSWLAMKIDAIERTFGEIEEPIRRGYITSSKPMVADIKSFMSKHHKTGATMRSFNSGTLTQKGTYYQFKFGFDMKKGGFPALILEYGDSGSPMRMPNKAYFFLHWAKKNHVDEIEDNMDAEFRLMIEEMGGS